MTPMTPLEENCIGCKPLAPAKLSEADYQRALAVLATRTDLTEEQRQSARAWLDSQMGR